MIVGSLRAVSLVLAWSLFLVASTSDYLGLSKSLVAGMRLVEPTVGQHWSAHRGLYRVLVQSGFSVAHMPAGSDAEILSAGLLRAW